jgi:hypothetical protein
MAESVAPMLEPGERLQVVFRASRSLWLVLAPFTVAFFGTVLMQGVAFWLAVGLAFCNIALLVGSCVLICLSRARLIAVTDRAIVELSVRDWRFVTAKRVIARHPRDVRFGRPWGFDAVRLGGRSLVIERKFFVDLYLADRIRYYGIRPAGSPLPAPLPAPRVRAGGPART